MKNAYRSLSLVWLFVLSGIAPGTVAQAKTAAKKPIKFGLDPNQKTVGAEKKPNPTATFKTNEGTFTAILFRDTQPKTVENFIGLATGKKEWTNPKTGNVEKNKPLYDGTIFHRVIVGFMIQGGDPLGKGTGGPGYQFADEPNLSHFDKAGILAMANSGTNTNGSQFFVTVAPTPFLEENGAHYNIFGEVTSGMDVVKQISQAAKDSNDRPFTEIKLESVTIQDGDKTKPATEPPAKKPVT